MSALCEKLAEKNFHNGLSFDLWLIWVHSFHIQRVFTFQMIILICQTLREAFGCKVPHKDWFQSAEMNFLCIMVSMENRCYFTCDWANLLPSLYASVKSTFASSSFSCFRYSKPRWHKAWHLVRPAGANSKALLRSHRAPGKLFFPYPQAFQYKVFHVLPPSSLRSRIVWALLLYTDARAGATSIALANRLSASL